MNREANKQYRTIENALLIIASAYKNALDNLSNVEVCDEINIEPTKE